MRHILYAIAAALTFGSCHPAYAATLNSGKRTVVNISGGGSDPTKLPLAGGVLTGNVTSQANIVLTSSSSLLAAYGNVQAGSATASGLQYASSPLSVFGRDANGQVAVFTSTPGNVGTFLHIKAPLGYGTGFAGVIVSSQPDSNLPLSGSMFIGYDGSTGDATFFGGNQSGELNLKPAGSVELLGAGNGSILTVSNGVIGSNPSLVMSSTGVVTLANTGTGAYLQLMPGPANSIRMGGSGASGIQFYGQASTMTLDSVGISMNAGPGTDTRITTPRNLILGAGGGGVGSFALNAGGASMSMPASGTTAISAAAGQSLILSGGGGVVSATLQNGGAVQLIATGGGGINQSAEGGINLTTSNSTDITMTADGEIVINNVTTGAVLCLNASKQLKTCTAVNPVDGTCTCP